MSPLTTLDALEALHPALVLGLFPLLEASFRIVASVSTTSTGLDVPLRAHPSLVTSFVTLEAKLLIAVERIVSVLAAQNAVVIFRLVWTLTGHVTKLPTVVALDGRVGITPVALLLGLFLELVVSVVFGVFIFFTFHFFGEFSNFFRGFLCLLFTVRFLCTILSFRRFAMVLGTPDETNTLTTFFNWL